MRLFELFDKPVAEVRWKKEVYGESATFDIDNNTYRVEFTFLNPMDFLQDSHYSGEVLPDDLRTMLENDVWPTDISFELFNSWHRHGTHDITDTGSEIKVFSTIVNLIQQFLSTNTDTQLVHISSKEPSRTKLYRRMISALAKGRKTWEIQSKDPGDDRVTYWVIKL